MDNQGFTKSELAEHARNKIRCGENPDFFNRLLMGEGSCSFEETISRPENRIRGYYRCFEDRTVFDELC